jgi:hypothetical protein
MVQETLARYNAHFLLAILKYSRYLNFLCVLLPRMKKSDDKEAFLTALEKENEWSAEAVLRLGYKSGPPATGYVTAFKRAFACFSRYPIFIIDKNDSPTAHDAFWGDGGFSVSVEPLDSIEVDGQVTALRRIDRRRWTASLGQKFPSHWGLIS